jgi:hypothetical protein
MFAEQVLYVYSSELPFSMKDHAISIQTYNDAWLLRGDHPKYYKNTDHIPFENRIALAKPYELLGDERCKAIRTANIQARQLMHQYHYNPGIRRKGAEIYAFEPPPVYPVIVRALQDAMLSQLCESGIAIETNPSSNYLIGTFRQYQSHPIVRFYNHGLAEGRQTRAFVSINTDDQGIFDTDLENEYALMASALQHATDKDGKSLYNPADIIRWLDDIRVMGLEQSFMLTHQNLMGD